MCVLGGRMKEPLLNIGNIKWVNLYFKSGYKPAFEYKGWEHLMDFVKHKKGRKPEGYQFYSDQGVYLLSITNILRRHDIIRKEERIW